MSTKKQLYTFVATATVEITLSCFIQERFSGIIGFVLADSEPDATSLAWSAAKDKFPASHGWYGHSIDIKPVPQDLIDQVANQEQ